MKLLAHGGGTTLASFGLLGLGLCHTLGENSGIFISSILGSLGITTLEGNPMTLVLKTLRGDETLNFRSLGIRFLSLTLRLNLTTNDEFADIIILGETEEFPNLRGTLGTKTFRVNHIGQAWDVALALLDDAECEDGEIHGYDAASNGFTLALACSSWSVARVAVGEEKSNTCGMHNTLLHGKSLLVVAASDLENVALEFIAHRVAGNLGAHPLVNENAELSIIFHVNELLAAIGREGDIKLHRVGRRDEGRVCKGC